MSPLLNGLSMIIYPYREYPSELNDAIQRNITQGVISVVSFVPYQGFVVLPYNDYRAYRYRVDIEGVADDTLLSTTILLGVVYDNFILVCSDWWLIHDELSLDELQALANKHNDFYRSFYFAKGFVAYRYIMPGFFEAEAYGSYELACAIDSHNSTAPYYVVPFQLTHCFGRILQYLNTAGYKFS